jgi:hypothetical protein
MPTLPGRVVEPVRTEQRVARCARVHEGRELHHVRSKKFELRRCEGRPVQDCHWLDPTPRSSRWPMTNGVQHSRHLSGFSQRARSFDTMMSAATWSVVAVAILARVVIKMRSASANIATLSGSATPARSRSARPCRCERCRPTVRRASRWRSCRAGRYRSSV